MNSSVAMRFSRSALTYSQGASLHETVADALLAAVSWPPADETRTILEAGCGTGVLTERLRRVYPGAWLTAFDAAPAMVRQTAARLDGDTGVVAVTADARTFVPPAPFDLVASSSALHWMTPLNDTMTSLARCVRPGGRLCVAMMIEGTLGELHVTRRHLFPEVVPATRLADAREVKAAVKAGGWNLEQSSERSFFPCYSSAEEFFRVIHAQGLTGGGVSHGRRLLTRGELARLTAAYGRAYRDAAGGVYATYRVLFLSARR